jgi:hypothetical protein
MKTQKIDINLSDTNRARLEARSYDRAYTEVPNRALPKQLAEEMGVIYQAISGEPMPEQGSTFLVRADNNGTFKRLYSPAVYSNESGDGLVIRWGNEDIPLTVGEGGIRPSNGDAKAKMSFKEEQVGKYSEAVLSVSYSKNGVVTSMPFPIKSVNWQEPVSADALDVLLDEAPQNIPALCAVAPDPSKRGEGSSGPRMEGPIIKIAQLPLGEYQVTTYRSRETQYGIDYLMQVVGIEEPFVGTARQQDPNTGEWGDVEVEIVGQCIVKPNNALKKVLSADPVITPQQPATLHVLEHGEYNGYATARCKLVCDSFVKSSDTFDLDF